MFALSSTFPYLPFSLCLPSPCLGESKHKPPLFPSPSPPLKLLLSPPPPPYPPFLSALLLQTRNALFLAVALYSYLSYSAHARGQQGDGEAADATVDWIG